MGIYDPTKNTEEQDVKINSVSTLGSDGFHDNLQKTLSKTNDLTLGALDRLRGWSDGINTLIGNLDSAVDATPLFNAGFGNVFLGQRVMHKPNEIVSRGVPPAEIYEECQKAEGLTVWDQGGLWHCLFPRSKIPYDYGTGETHAFGVSKEEAAGLLSREDVETDTGHKHGIFFANLEDMLGWQAGMKRAMAEQKRKQWADWEAKEKAKWTFIGGDKKEEDGDKQVVGRETETSMVTLSNGDMERKIVQRRSYADGTSRIWERTEVVAPDGTVKELKSS